MNASDVEKAYTLLQSHGQAVARFNELSRGDKILIGLKVGSHYYDVVEYDFQTKAYHGLDASPEMRDARIRMSAAARSMVLKEFAYIVYLLHARIKALGITLDDLSPALMSYIVDMPEVSR